ncbi:MAG: hypothetical protein NTW21_41830 [Verrucomicrobia bacterium]|nr:hypothetical protein [Verrucomicrobiota bacterium]
MRTTPDFSPSRRLPSRLLRDLLRPALAVRSALSFLMQKSMMGASLLFVLAGIGLFVNPASAGLAVVDQAATAFCYDFTSLGTTQTRDESITVSPGVSTLVVMLGWRNNDGAGGG